MDSQTVTRFRFATAMYAVISFLMIICVVACLHGIGKSLREQSKEKSNVQSSEDIFVAEKSKIIKALGPFEHSIQIDVLDTVDRPDYVSAPNEDWSGSIEHRKDVAHIFISRQYEKSEHIRYYLARARISELANSGTSTWVTVGLPHLLRFDDGFDRQSYNYFMNYVDSFEEASPDIELMKKDPAYRNKMRGYAWLMMYYLHHEKGFSIENILQMQEDAFPKQLDLIEYAKKKLAIGF